VRNLLPTHLADRGCRDKFLPVLIERILFYRPVLMQQQHFLD
jgi:hypothetical protein